MSRIHEALKKAELDGSAVTTLTDLRLAEREASVASKQGSVAQLSEVKNEINLPPLADFSQITRSLRFEDISSKCAHVSWRPDPLTNVFVNPSLNREATEQFRTLRSRLYHLRADNSMRVVLITSAISGDGKTFVASNLAQAIVRQPDRRVLLIDADLRSSRLHVPLGATAGPGLGEYLSGTADEMAVIQHGQEGGLYFIAGGTPVSNASELLSNGRLKTLIERAVSCFDWIIFDSPPCLPVADASVLAGLCDGILLVVRAGTTPSSAADKACQELRQRNLVGVVLNGVDEKVLTYGSYYGGGHYGHAVGDDANQ
jgi:capsular exopolysaccharide synthesis family protein